MQANAFGIMLIFYKN